MHGVDRRYHPAHFRCEAGKKFVSIDHLQITSSSAAALVKAEINISAYGIRLGVETVTGKIPLIFNLFLAVLLASILFSMYTELSGEKTIKRKPSEYVFHKLDRLPPLKTMGFGKIFDADSTPRQIRTP